MKSGRISFSAVALITLSFPAFAQTQAINGSIRGRVTDQSGSPVSQAEVAVENTQTGFYRTMNSNDDGY